jgi:hypothetical protein
MKLGLANSAPDGSEADEETRFPNVSSRRTPGSIRRVVSLRRCGSCLCYQLMAVAMGHGIRRDDANIFYVRYVDRCIAGFSIGFLASLRLCAVLISAMWVSACGKLPV